MTGLLSALSTFSVFRIAASRGLTGNKHLVILHPCDSVRTGVRAPIFTNGTAEPWRSCDLFQVNWFMHSFAHLSDRFIEGFYVPNHLLDFWTKVGLSEQQAPCSVHLWEEPSSLESSDCSDESCICKAGGFA